MHYAVVECWFGLWTYRSGSGAWIPRVFHLLLSLYIDTILDESVIKIFAAQMRISICRQDLVSSPSRGKGILQTRHFQWPIRTHRRCLRLQNEQLWERTYRDRKWAHFVVLHLFCPNHRRWRPLVSQGSRGQHTGGFVDNSHDTQTCYCSCILCCLSLSVIEVSGNSDDCISYLEGWDRFGIACLFAQIVLGNLLHLS